MLKMLMKSKVALSFALTVGMTSAAMAVTRHPVPRQMPAAAHRRMPTAAYQAYGYAYEHGQVKKILGETGAVLIQDRDEAQSNGYAPEKYW